MRNKTKRKEQARKEAVKLLAMVIAVAFVTGGIVGGIIGYWLGIGKIKLPETTATECQWVPCDCRNCYGEKIFRYGYHCSVHGDGHECYGGE